jgi:hypothetical protein
MARSRKTLVDAVAGSVTEAVASAIDAIAHPMQAVGLAKGKAGIRTKAGRKALSKSVKVKAAARKSASKVADKMAGKKPAKGAVKKAAKKASKGRR